MKRFLRMMLHVLMLVLVACGGGADTAVPTALTNKSVAEPTRSALSAPTTMPEVVNEATEIVVVESAVPASVLFDTSWQDREIFRAGLVTTEQPVLDRLPGAPVYHLDLQIEEGNSVVNGRQELLYTNQENVPLHELYFHLFPNLLEGSIEISHVLINGEEAVPVYQSFNNSEMQLPLSGSLQPGEQVVVQLDFVTAVPLETGRNYGVLAYVEDILALAHFYPQVAVYDDHGWHIETPAEGGDVTYSDAGFYLVRVTAPADLVMATGGIEVAREKTADTQTITFAGGPMRDFYLAASDRYQVTSQTIGEITVNSYAPAEYAQGSTAAVSYALNAIESYSSHFAPYPYTELDIVTTPTLALGIEYPGIIADRLAIYDSGDSSSGLPNQVLLESTTAHEVGHQWFYSLVGNDQLDEPWLDESLTQYATYLYYLDQYGEEGAQGFYESLNGRWSRVDNAKIPIGLPVAAYSGAEYGAIVYGRGPLFFAELANSMGQENFSAFLHDYTNIHKWGIATTASLKQIAEAHCNCDLTPLFVQWVYGS
jgi:hypothetical protein